MSTTRKTAIRVGALFGAAVLISLLTSTLIWVEVLDNLPDSFQGIFLTPTTSDVLMHSVFGTITFDGEPIVDGEVRFVSLNKNFNPDFAKIRNGKYVAQVKEGEHKVEIRGLKDGVQFIPPRFNAVTELRFQAKDGEKSFDLR